MKDLYPFSTASSQYVVGFWILVIKKKQRIVHVWKHIKRKKEICVVNHQFSLEDNMERVAVGIILSG